MSLSPSPEPAVNASISPSEEANSAKAKRSRATIFWTLSLGIMALVLTLFIVWIAQPAIEHGLWWIVAFLLVGAVGLWAGAFQSWVKRD